MRVLLLIRISGAWNDEIWKTLESLVDQMLFRNIRSAVAVWKIFFHKIHDVKLFLGGETTSVENKSISSGILITVISLSNCFNSWKVKKNSTLQLHYVSPESQNEFIKCSVRTVTKAIIKGARITYQSWWKQHLTQIHIDQTDYVFLCLLEEWEGLRWNKYTLSLQTVIKHK